MKRAALAILTLAFAVPLGGVGIARAGTTSPAPVVVIALENHSYGEVVGSDAAPYLNRHFIPAGKLYTNYRAITHPSLPNYLAMTSGTTSGCGTDVCPTGRYRTANVFSQLQDAGLHWRAYQEGMPSRCALDDAGRYLVRHNPPPYFRNLADGSCRRGDLPYPDPVPTPLRAFTFVTPDACHDMHDCSVADGDRWLKEHVPAFLDAGAIVVITFDEGTGTQRVMTAVAGPGITSGGRSHAAFDHFGLLAGLEDHFGLRRLHHAKDARPLPLG